MANNHNNNQSLASMVAEFDQIKASDKATSTKLARSHHKARQRATTTKNVLRVLPIAMAVAIVLSIVGAFIL